MKYLKKYVFATTVLVLLTFAFSAFADFKVYEDKFSPKSITLLKQYLFLNCMKSYYEREFHPAPTEVIKKIDNEAWSIVQITSYGAVELEKFYNLATKQGGKKGSYIIFCLDWSMSKKTHKQIMKVLHRDRRLDPE